MLASMRMDEVIELPEADGSVVILIVIKVLNGLSI
jgi:hypothetical protein